MNITCLASGSSGNCYILTDDYGEQLILDAGVKSMYIKEALKFSFNSVCGVLVTHGHRDHNLSADELEMYGLDVWKPYLIEGGRDKRTFGKYAVSSFPVEHDGEPCTGFLIKHIDGFKMLYLTDLEYSSFKFTSQKVDCMLIECNYMQEYTETTLSQFRHKVLGHMSLETCEEFVRVNKSENLKNVILCHMNHVTCDARESVDRIKAIVGDAVNVTVAKPWKVVEL